MYLYTSRSSDSPKLNNTWGDFNKVINYVLDGGALQTVKSIEAIGSNKCKISFTTSIPFVQFQTIDITGATNTAYNTRLFVENIDIGTLTLTCYSKTLPDAISKEETANIKAKVIACGMQKVFGGVAEERTIFKTTNGICYRIDDRDFRPLVNPPVVPATANNSWQKVARVCMAENFDSLDSSTSRLFPYSNLRPTENFNPVDKYIGQTFISYNRSYNDYSSSDTSDYITYNQSIARGSLEWNIFSNDEIMYVFLTGTGTGSYQCTASYVFGEFNIINNNMKNGMLICNKMIQYNETYDSTNWSTAMGSTNGSNRNPIFPSPYTNSLNGASSTAVIYDNLKNSYADISCVSEFNSSSIYSGNGGIKYPNELDNGFYICDVIIRGDSNYYGKLKNIKYICNNVVTSAVINSESIKNGSLVVIDGVHYYAQKNSNSYMSSNNNMNMVILIKVER